jgi:hypothetical protein
MKATHTQEKPTMDKLTDMMRQLMRDRFFGDVNITFQNGKPHTIKVHRTYKLDEL